ncbi:GMC family oxidoreductase N-terminal domain-containing protein [Frateuria edaphi]|uniref:GMC family oxidoreductase n=1 Tax=Frateuria edaphi TaxID=2898793 RepID=UPI001E285AF3|nr:GMC family oxidoreductase N-terminal domain-containing protein [Frateuria edaphi]UGB44541.1 GMC family oxidoreductase N-terminal domain-containing protein [Frateuria edaphi]
MSDRESADFIVVGAGPAGCAVAARLADAPGRPTVFLVETGPATPSWLSRVPMGIAALVPFRSRHNYAYETVPQAHLDGRRGYVPRGRGVGGSSLINAMICTRGQPEDYDGWAALGCAGWAWDDVLPVFRDIEDNQRGADAWHGVGGPLPVSDLRSPSPMSRAFVEAAVQCGYPRNDDFNGPRQEGVGLYQVYQRDGRRIDAGRAYLGDGKARPNLRVLAGRPVQRILFEGHRARGVLVGGRRLLARREVILCGGAIGSPQLLMLSGIGPGAHLRELGIPVLQDAPDVGGRLQDHIDYTANLRVRAEGLFGMNPTTLARMVASGGAYRRRGEGMLTSNAAEAGGFIRSRPEVTRPDLQLHFCIGMVDDHNRRMHLSTGMALHVCVLRPSSRGRVRLARADVAAAPLIDPDFLSAPQDTELLVEGARIVRRILAAPALAAFGGRLLYGTGSEDDEGLRALIRAHADTIYHPVGTCRMGADEGAVVDPQLRVRGIQGLRVADASIMPTLISGNTEAPSAMIGEMAARFVLADNP